MQKYLILICNHERNCQKVPQSTTKFSNRNLFIEYIDIVNDFYKRCAWFPMRYPSSLKCQMILNKGYLGWKNVFTEEYEITFGMTYKSMKLYSRRFNWIDVEELN